MTKEYGGGGDEGDWIVPERIIKKINTEKQDRSPKVINQGLNSWENRTKQTVNEELMSFRDIINAIQNIF